MDAAREVKQAHFEKSTDARMALVLRIEWTLLLIRYVAFLVFLAAYSLGVSSAHVLNAVVICLAMLAHNFFSHWVFYTARHHHFIAPINFCWYFGMMTLVVALTGAENSPFACCYMLVLVGYTAYQPAFLTVYRVTLLCCIAYTFSIVAHWLVMGINIHYSPTALNLGFFFISGWLLNSLNVMMQRHRYQAQSRAEALASSEAMLRTILDSAADPIILFDDEEFIADVNRRACEFFNASIEEMVGKRFRAFFFDDGTFPTKLATLRSRGRYHGEEVALMPSSEERMVDLVVQSFLRDNRRYFVAMLHDITAQKDSQETSRQSTLQLEQANRELQKVNQLRMEFFLTVSKRLRSPLSSILGFSNLLLEEALGEIGEEQRKALHSCRRSVYRVFSMMDEALQWDSSPTREEEGREETSASSKEQGE